MLTTEESSFDRTRTVWRDIQHIKKCGLNTLKSKRPDWLKCKLSEYIHPIRQIKIPSHSADGTANSWSIWSNVSYLTWWLTEGDQRRRLCISRSFKADVLWPTWAGAKFVAKNETWLEFKHQVSFLRNQMGCLSLFFSSSPPTGKTFCSVLLQSYMLCLSGRACDASWMQTAMSRMSSSRFLLRLDDTLKHSSVTLVKS